MTLLPFPSNIAPLPIMFTDLFTEINEPFPEYIILFNTMLSPFLALLIAF